jgi:demethylmenaquinone methyltransferase / 2-methoxy-6-polyprenyl-1,4-benzoquinol methylase
VSETPRPMSAPHAPLTEYYGSEPERRAWVRGLFDRTAVDYDRIEALMSGGSGAWYRGHALARAGLAPGMQVLDVACGTGLVTAAALAQVGAAGSVTAVDPSLGMLAAGGERPGILRVGAMAECLPFSEGRFDFLSMGFALRHVSDIAAVFAEYFRVLRPGGRVCILEITRPEGALARAALKAYMRGIVPLVARVVGRRDETAILMRYYWDTIEACVPPAAVTAALTAAGFEDVDRYVELGIFSEYRARRPASR